MGVRWGGGYVGGGGGGYVGGGVRWGEGYVGGRGTLGGGVRWGEGYVGGRSTSWVAGTLVGGGYVGGTLGVRWGGGGSTLAGGYVGEGGVDVRSWSKVLFLGTFWKITTCWSPLDERVRSSFAESCRN